MMLDLFYGGFIKCFCCAIRPETDILTVFIRVEDNLASCLVDCLIWLIHVRVISNDGFSASD